MKKRAKITSKGQIAVPHEVRRPLGVRPGDSLGFEKRGSCFFVRALQDKSPFEKFRGIGNPGIPSGRKAVLRYFRKLRGR